MSTPARFSDGQYKNWLKCSQSLIIMKEALHDYIDNEVKNLHSSITQKVSSIPCGSSTGNQCGSCSSKDIKLTGGKPKTWSINCKNSICDKWLHQILAVHDDPHNPTINWKNADISKWPTECYQVAKIFMPKGQDKTTKMPEDLDAPAILSLMKYCNWFRNDLPNTQILSDLIDIRNKVLHSGDLRVADTDKDSWIDLMIQLLIDLHIHGDAQLQMLKREDIDINFRETEIKVLQHMLSCLENDLTTVKEDMDCAQKLQSQLSEELKHLRDNNVETTRIVDTLQTDIEQTRKSLDELKNISDKMVSFFDKNTDIYDIKITEIIRNIARNVQDQQINLSKVGTELSDIRARLSKLEEEIKQLWTKQEETNNELYRLEKRFEKERENDEELSSQNEAPRKSRRIETDRLKELKNHTEDKLNSLKRLGFIPTKQTEEAKKVLERKRSIVIKGNPGEGKTTTALHLIDDEIYRDKRVVLNYPKQWERVDTDWVDIVVIEDVFGRFDLDSGRLQEWIVHLPTIQEHVDVGKLRVIITTRVDILSKAYSNVRSLKLFSDDLTMMLSSEQLTNSEKMSILNRELNRHKKTMKEDEKEKCVANFIGLIGFPQCCQLFAADSKSFDRGSEFFRSPEKFFVSNITELDDTGFLCLAFLFCSGEIWEQDLSPETMPGISKHLLLELASHLHISNKKASVILLREAYDRFVDLYVVKYMSFYLSTKSLVSMPRIQFIHATVCEAVGKVLGDRCVEMVVKYCNSEYLYQRTYTATVKDVASQNVFIPLSVYRLLAERMVHDVVDCSNRTLIGSVVTHSALRQQTFVMELKFKLLSDNCYENFFMDTSEFCIRYDGDEYYYHDDECSILDLLERNCTKSDASEECNTFLQYILKRDEDVVRLVYSQLLEFLACVHNSNSDYCWQCEEKQTLLELALKYHHFQIADKLITMKACYTHASLCNAVKHGDLERVHTIIVALKMNQVFNSGCEEAKFGLCRAYISGNQSLIQLLLKEGITLDSWHVTYAVRDGDMKVLMKVVEHLKCHKKWKPYWEKQSTYMHQDCIDTDWHCADVEKQHPCSTALFLACVYGKFDMVDYLLNNEVKGSMCMFIGVPKWSSVQGIARVIQTLKHTKIWDPKCAEATNALELAHRLEKTDVCDLLVQEGVSLTMKSLPNMVSGASLEYIRKTIQNMKDTKNWDPKSDDASKAFKNAYSCHMYDVCDLLVQEGVPLTMENLPNMVYRASFEYIKKAIQNLKNSKNWDPKCDDASTAVANAYSQQKDDVINLLVQEGVSIKMKNLPNIVDNMTFEYIKKAIQNIKDTDNWDPKCDDAYTAFIYAYYRSKYDVCDVLFQNGVALTMKKLPNMVHDLKFEYIKKVIQNMKDTDNWDPTCKAASTALHNAYSYHKNDVYDLLVQEGVQLTMELLSEVLKNISFEDIKIAIHNMKESDNWDPKCEDASKALQNAYRYKKYDVCDLLVQEGIPLTMKNLPDVLYGVSFEYTRKSIQNMKDMDNWDPMCEGASTALEHACSYQQYDVCDLLVQEGVQLTMKNLPRVVWDVSFEYLRKIIQNLKDSEKWDAECDDASDALTKAYRHRRFNVCDLLVQERVSPTMKTLFCITNESLETVKKVVQDLKATNNWNPKSYYASGIFENAYGHNKYDVCDLLLQEGLSLSIKNLPSVTIVLSASLDLFMRVIQNLKDTDNWDPKCDDASKALEYAYIHQKYDIYDLLVHEGVSLPMKNLPDMVRSVSLEYIRKAIQNMKDTEKWDPKCGDASFAFIIAYIDDKCDVCDLLVQEGVLLTMKNFLNIVTQVPLEIVKKLMQNIKDTNNWDPKSDDASKALEKAYIYYKVDLCDLLIHAGVSLSMKNVCNMACCVSFEYIKKAIQNMKESDNWDPKCEDASEALCNTYKHQKYAVGDLLVHEGVSLTMKDLPRIAYSASLESVKKAIQHLEYINNWDPKCDDASKALENAYIHDKYDVCDLLVQEGISLTMKSIPVVTGAMCETFETEEYDDCDHPIVREVPLQYIKKVIQNMKETYNWDPNCDDASKTFETAYALKRYDVCDLLVQEGVSLAMKNLPSVVMSVSFDNIKKIILNIKDTQSWDPKCDDASKAFENAFVLEEYDVCDLLVQEGASLTMRNLPNMVDRTSFESIKKAIQNMKDTGNWDPKCDDASRAFINASRLHMYDICDLLFQEGVSLTMKNLHNMIDTVSSEFIKKAIQNMKNAGNWDLKCADASKALENTYINQNYDVCDLLVQEGVSLTMNNFPNLVYTVPFEYIKKAIQNMKDTGNWDITCDDASKAFENACGRMSYDVCNLLVQEGISITMGNLHSVVVCVSFQNIRKAIQNIKGTTTWDPKCDDAAKAFRKAYKHQRYDVCDLLIQEGVLQIKQ